MRGRLICIEDTPMTRRMGIAGWQGYSQADLEEYGLFFFARPDSLSGDPAIGLSDKIPWYYVEPEANPEHTNGA